MPPWERTEAMTRRFRRTKRIVVAAEIVLGSFLLATTTALLFQLFVGASEASARTLDSGGQAVAVLLLMGVVLFADGLRRGKTWW